MAQEETSASQSPQVMSESTNSAHHQHQHHHTTAAAPVSINMHKDEEDKNNNCSSSSSLRSKGINHHAFSSEQVKHALQVTMSDDTAEHQGQHDEQGQEQGGILASGLGWLQRKREQRRRLLLQQQAERQLQKIYEAERRRAYEAETDLSQQQQPHAPQQEEMVDSNNLPIRASKSGQGASGKLVISSLEEDENNYMNDDDDDWFPDVRIETTEEEEQGRPPRRHILNQAQMNQVAALVLPQTISFCRWRRLYDLGRDGDSFDGCLRIVSDTKRTLMVIRTTKGHVFGGYADSAWNANHIASARFYGNATACLFSVIPDSDDGEIKVYKWSGKNRYIQLCDPSRKMFAFGGGGDDGAFGLAVEEDFQRGSTGHCDTFDNEPLCEDGHFEIVDLEIWEFLTGFY